MIVILDIYNKKCKRCGKLFERVYLVTLKSYKQKCLQCEPKIDILKEYNILKGVKEVINIIQIHPTYKDEVEWARCKEGYSLRRDNDQIAYIHFYPRHKCIINNDELIIPTLKYKPKNKLYLIFSLKNKSLFNDLICDIIKYIHFKTNILIISDTGLQKYTKSTFNLWNKWEDMFQHMYYDIKNISDLSKIFYYINYRT